MRRRADPHRPRHRPARCWTKGRARRVATADATPTRCGRCTAPVAILTARVRFADCEIHHVIEWIHQHGPTNLANLLPLCNEHHHLVHDAGWHLTLHPDRTITLRRPDGTVAYHGSSIDVAPTGLTTPHPTRDEPDEPDDVDRRPRPGRRALQLHPRRMTTTRPHGTQPAHRANRARGAMSVPRFRSADRSSRRAAAPDRTRRTVPTPPTSRASSPRPRDGANPRGARASGAGRLRHDAERHRYRRPGATLPPRPARRRPAGARRHRGVQRRGRALCYRESSAPPAWRHDHPRITLDSIPSPAGCPRSTPATTRRSPRSCWSPPPCWRPSGADFALCPDNSAHSRGMPMSPWLHIDASSAIVAALHQVLGTRFT